MTLSDRLAANPALRISMVYLLFSGLWILLSDRLLEAALGPSPDLVMLQTFKGLGFVAVTTLMLYALIRRVQLKPAPHPASVKTFPIRTPLFIFGVLVLAASLTGWGVYRALHDSIRQNEIRHLREITEQKIQQITDWLAERHADAAVVSVESFMALELARWQQLPEKERTSLASHFQKRFSSLIEHYRYLSITYYDSAGIPLLHSGSSIQDLDHGRAVKQAMAEQRTLLVDFHRHQDNGKNVYRMGLMAPVIAQGKCIGALYLKIDPMRHLLPRLVAWEVPNQNAETALLKVEGNRIVHLNPPKFLPVPPLELTHPLADPNLATAALGSGQRGLIEGKRDYRGRRVLAYGAAVPGTSWLLIAHTEEAEVYRPLHRLGLLTALLTLFFILLGGSLIRMWWERERDRYQARQTELELQQQLLAKRYDFLSKHANDVILLTDETGRFIEANDRAVEIYGYGREELLGMNLSSLRTDKPAEYPLENTSSDPDRLVYQAEMRRKDGTLLQCEISARLIGLEGGQTYCHMVVRDITARLQAETRLQKLNRLYATLSQTNTALVHLGEEDEEKLFQAICRIAVESGGIKLAWVGRLDPETQQVLPVAVHGTPASYVKGIRISLRDDIPEGRGPTGTCMREHHPVIVPDFSQDTVTAPWHARAAKAGLGSSAAFPIARNGQPYAAFMAYHAQPGFFDMEVVDLLAEMSQDIEFALGLLDARREQRALLQRLQSASLIVEMSPVVLWVLGAEAGWPVEFVSENVRQYGYSAEDLLSGRIGLKDILHPEDIGRVMREVEHYTANGASSFSQQYRIRCKDGSIRWLENRTTVIRDAQGNAIRYQGVTSDITQRVESEQRVIENQALMSTILNNIGAHVYLKDAAGRYQYVTPSWLEFWGIPLEKATGATDEELFGNELAVRILASDKRVLTKGRTVEQEETLVSKKTGKSAIFWTVKLPLRHPDGTIYGLCGIATDITARVQADLALHQAEQRFRAYFERSMLGMAISDAEKRWVEVNPALCRLFGYSEEELTRKTWAEMTHPEDLAADAALFDRVLAGEIDEYELDKRFIRSDGATIYTHLAARAIRRPDGSIDYFIALVDDITERIKAEQELRESEERFRSLVEQSLAGAYILQDGVVVYANPRLKEILGYPSDEEVAGRNPLDSVAEKDRTRVARHLQELLKGTATSPNLVFTALRKDGSTVEVGVNSTRATYRGRPAIIGLMQDITERKVAEEQIRRYTERLQTAFMQTVNLATTLSEMRDPYTAGHERRVAEIAVAIGTEMGLSEQQLVGLKVGGYLHDVGKTAIPIEILAKPGRITPAEFELIKAHPQAGHEVLKDVDFPWPVAQIALQHHERLDGSGYPQGLKNGEILLEARIIAVADVFEAMSSHRPYRPGLGTEAALAELEKGRDTAYDPQVVDALLRLVREKGYTPPQ